MYTLLKPKRHLLRCHGFVVHALLLRMHTNVVDFRVMRRLCRREWNWQSVNQHSWDPRQRTTWSRRVTSDFNSVLHTMYKSMIWNFKSQNLVYMCSHFTVCVPLLKGLHNGRTMLSYIQEHIVYSWKQFESAWKSIWVLRYCKKYDVLFDFSAISRCPSLNFWN